MIQFFVHTIYILGLIHFYVYLIVSNRNLWSCTVIINPSVSTFSPALFSHRLVFTISVFLILCAYRPFRVFSQRSFWLILSVCFCLFLYAFCCLYYFIVYAYFSRCEIELISWFLYFFTYWIFFLLLLMCIYLLQHPVYCY